MKNGTEAFVWRYSVKKSVIKNIQNPLENALQTFANSLARDVKL